MKLNHDYIRDILLYIENNLDYENPSNPRYHDELLFGKLLSDDSFDKYNKEELTYTLELLLKENFIECTKPPRFAKGGILSADIVGLTWSGHELLDNIRNNTIWNAVKERANKVGKVSIAVLANTANTLASAIMANPEALNNFLQGVDNIGKML